MASNELPSSLAMSDTDGLEDMPEPEEQDDDSDTECTGQFDARSIKYRLTSAVSACSINDNDSSSDGEETSPRRPAESKSEYRFPAPWYPY